MTQRKKRDPHVALDGEILTICDGHLFLTCCDCGLTHVITFYEPGTKKGDDLRAIESPILLRLFRDIDATKYQRQKKKG